ncbi:universal stress protein [Streptomyces sp. NPDC002845]
MFRPVAAGLDGSRESVAAAAWAAREALRRGLPLRLVHACAGLPEDGTDTALPELRAPRDRAHRVREKLSEGRPAHVLVEAADGAALLVAGRRRRRTATGSHAGPVAHALIRHAHCPVAVVPHD